MKLLLIMMAALMLPIVPALACFPQQQEEEILFASEGRSFDRSPIPMSFCESGERSFVVVMGKCYDQDAITDYDTEEECQADPVCKAYREQQSKQRNPEDIDICKETPTFPTCYDDTIDPPTPEQEPEPVYDCSHEGLGQEVCRPIDQGDPNHGEIKGDEELEQDEEEHQEEEEQGEEESEETTAETVE